MGAHNRAAAHSHRLQGCEVTPLPGQLQCSIPPYQASLEADVAKPQQSRVVWATDASGRYRPYPWHQLADDLMDESRGKLQSTQKDCQAQSC